jgi:hypothetical protein
MSVFGRRWRLGGEMYDLDGFGKYLRERGLVARPYPKTDNYSVIVNNTTFKT